MISEKNVVLAVATLGSVYLCNASLKKLNENYNPGTLPFYCNYFTFGFSIGIFYTLTKNIILVQ